MAQTTRDRRITKRPSHDGHRRGWVRILLIPLVIVFDVVLAIWAWAMFDQGLWIIGCLAIAIGALISVGMLRARATALRWLIPTLAFMLAFTVAPIIYTGFIAFTNYNGVHLLTQQQALDAFERRTYVPDGVTPFRWAAYESPEGTLAIYLVPAVGEELAVDESELEELGDGEADAGDEPTTPGDGAQTPSPEPEETSPPDEQAPPTESNESDVFAIAGGGATDAEPGTGDFGAADADGFPTEIAGYTRLSSVETVVRITEITKTEFGDAPTFYRVLTTAQAAPIERVYDIDPSTSVLTDRETGIEYAPQSDGFFASADGDRLSPAYQAVVGTANFVELFGNEKVRGPFLQILLWNTVFAVFVVLIQFILGMLYAVVINGREVHPRVARIVRAVLLLPYVIPAYLTILTWSSLFGQQAGLIPETLEALFGLDPVWIQTAAGARIAMLVVGVWLGFPYFLLVCTGALQSIPGELIEAAAVDGAGIWKRFTSIVFPMIMRSIAPLVVLAFAFNFNNFLIAYLLFKGSPPKPDAQVPAGETDLLISFTYKMSFDYAIPEYSLAAAVTVMIFVALTPIVVSQLRFYNAWRKDG